MIEMNKKNKARIKKIVGALSGAAAGQIIPEIKEELEDILFDESMSRDNMEDYFSETERFREISDNCDYLENAIDAIDEDDPLCISNVLDELSQISVL